MEWNHGIYFLTTYLPKLIKILTAEIVKSPLGEELATLNFLIDEGDDDLLKISDFIQALTAVRDLYEAISIFENVDHKPLYLSRIDSGSKKLFSVFGAAQVIFRIKSTLIEISQRLFFFDAKQMEANYKATIAGCELIKEIAKLEKLGAMTPAAADKTKKMIVRSFSKLLETNTYIEEMKALGIETKSLSNTAPKLIEFKTDSNDNDSESE